MEKKGEKRVMEWVNDDKIVNIDKNTLDVIEKLTMTDYDKYKDKMTYVVSVETLLDIIDDLMDVINVKDEEINDMKSMCDSYNESEDPYDMYGVSRDEF